MVPVYGTSFEPAVSNVKLVPVEERITYTWSGINVFTNVGMVSNESNFFPCWKTNPNQGVQGKHLLKNGKIPLDNLVEVREIFQIELEK